MDTIPQYKDNTLLQNNKVRENDDNQSKRKGNKKR